MVRLDAGTAPVPVAEGGLGTPRGVVSIAGADARADGLGAVIGYAAAPGQVALDGDAGGNSPYAAALLKHLPASGFAFSDVMTMVTEEVYLKTGARQLPWTNASLRRLLYFGGSPEQDEDGDQALIRGERRKLLAYHLDVRRRRTPAGRRQGTPGRRADGRAVRHAACGRSRHAEGSRAARQTARRPVGAAEVAARRAPDAGEPGIPRSRGFPALPMRRSAKARWKPQSSFASGRRIASRHFLRPSTRSKTTSGQSASSLPRCSPTAPKPMRWPMTTSAPPRISPEAYDEVARWDDALALRYKLKQARALSDLGFYKADQDASQRAIDAYRLAAALAPADKNPAGWVDSQSGLAMVIWAIGQRAAGTSELDEAASVLGAAIESPALAGRPEQTAQLEADLSLVLLTIGMREPGTERLQESAVYARQALQVKTREAAPERVGAAAEPSRLGVAHARHARAVDGARRRGGYRFSRRARSVDPRQGSARLGQCREQSRPGHRPDRQARDATGQAGGGGRLCSSRRSRSAPARLRRCHGPKR